MIQRINNTKALSKIGALVSVDTNNPEAFIYTTPNSTKALGIVAEAKPYKSPTKIATIGDTASVLVSGNVVKGDVIRANKKSDRISLGICAVAKDTDSPFLRIGEALEAGKGLIKVVLELAYQGTDTSGYVPYSGATDEVNLGTHGLTLGNDLILQGGAMVYRHIRVTAPSWAMGAVAPTSNRVGIVPTIAFDSVSDDSVHYSLICPYRMAEGTVINVALDWCYTGAQDNGTVCWALEYICLEEGEAVAGATTTITRTTAGNHLTGTMVRTTLPTGIVGAVAHDVLGLRLFRDVSEDTLGTDAEMIETHFGFTMDKLGQPI